MSIAPKIGSDIFGTKQFTVNIALRNSANTADSSLGIFECLNNSGATVTGSATRSITFVGTQAQVNSAVAQTRFVPNADVQINLSFNWTQTDDNATATPGSNPVNANMLLNIDQTHEEFSSLLSTFFYNEDELITRNIGTVTDQRSDNINANIQYSCTLVFTVAVEDVRGWTNTTGNTWVFTGTKSQVNQEISSVEIVHAAGVFTNFDINLTVRNETDGVTQYTQIVAVTTGTADIDFVLHSPSVVLSHDSITHTLTVNLGDITDQRPENINPNIQYSATLSFDVTIENIPGWTNTTGNIWTFTGTKSQVNSAISSINIEYNTPVGSQPQTDGSFTASIRNETNNISQFSQLTTVSFSEAIKTHPLHTLNNPTPQSSDLFGISVAISGNTVIVGAHQDDTGASNAGSVYIFSATNSALLRTINNPDPYANDFFGASVAIDGNIAIVGAYGAWSGETDSGKAYIYNVTTGARLHTLNNPVAEFNDQFGRSVAISGNRAIVGAWLDHFGGFIGPTDTGSAYIYDVTTGALLHTLSNPTQEPYDQFGVSVAISGNTAIVGAHQDDTGASNAGSAYIYDVTTGALLHTLNNPTPASGDVFGGSVAISGNTAIVGANGDDTSASNAGSAYIYDVTTGALLHTINNPAPAAGDVFGYSVAISGNTAIVSAWLDDIGFTDTGSAYIYDVTTGALLHTINNPTPATNDYFGQSVAISGNLAVVGASYDDTSAGNSGSAYIFDVNNIIALVDLL